MITNLGLGSAFSNNPGDVPSGVTEPRQASLADSNVSMPHNVENEIKPYAGKIEPGLLKIAQGEMDSYNGISKNSASLSFGGIENTIHKAGSFLNKVQAFIRKEVSVVYNYLVANSDKIQQGVKKILDMLPKPPQGGNI